MAHSPTTLTKRSGAPIAALAIVAMMLTIGLGGWRANVLMSPNVTAGQTSATEASLLQIIEPIVGAENVRISVNTTDTGARTILVLLDAGAQNAAPSQSATVERLVSTAMGVGESSRDQIVVEQAVFASGLPGRLTAANYGELLGFVILAGLLSWIALAARNEDLTSATVATERVPVEPVRATKTPTKPSVQRAEPSTEVVDLVRRDPSRAADVLRGWMNSKGDAA